MNRYENLANVLSDRIEQGLYPAGIRLPSVRVLSSEHGVSVSTVQQAYRVLEEKQLVEARPKSGYFVKDARLQAALPAVCRPTQRPVDISQWDQVLELITSPHRPGVVQLGRGSPDVTAATLRPLSRLMGRAGQHQNLNAFHYDSIYGSEELREQIARLMIDSGSHMDASNILITTGCHEALSIAIRSVCEQGDIVAVDSPSFHGAMQTLKGFGMKALEIPTDPVTGISLEALEMALEQWPVKAIQLTPNCNNPLGYNMPDDRKKVCCDWHNATISPLSKTMFMVNWRISIRALLPSLLSMKMAAYCCAARFQKRWRPVYGSAGSRRVATMTAHCT